MYIDRGTPIVGDLDENRIVNSDDAIYLLYHTLMPNQYPVYQDVDFDGNGIINSNDAIHLLYQILAPEEGDEETKGDEEVKDDAVVEDDDETGWSPFF